MREYSTKDYFEKFMRQGSHWPGEHHFTACFLLPRLAKLKELSKLDLLYINPDGNLKKENADVIVGDLVWGTLPNGRDKSKDVPEIALQIEAKVDRSSACKFKFTYSQAKGLSHNSIVGSQDHYSKTVYIFANQLGVVVMTGDILRKREFDCGSWQADVTACEENKKISKATKPRHGDITINLKNLFKHGSLKEGSKFFAWTSDAEVDAISKLTVDDDFDSHIKSFIVLYHRAPMAKTG